MVSVVLPLITLRHRKCSTGGAVVAFDEGERTLIEKYSHFYGLYNVVNLPPPPPQKIFQGRMTSSPCHVRVSLFGVISHDKIVLCYGLLSLLFGGFSSKEEEF